VQVDVSLSNKGLKLFVNGDKIWLEERILVSTKKNKKDELLKKDHPPYPKMKEGLRMKLINNHGRIPMPPPYEGSMSNAKHGGVGSHAATTSSTIHVPCEVFMALHPTNARRRNRKRCLSNWLSSPLEQFSGGPAQS
jgi:hypothetical protein